jgi:hypothetical protein
MVVSLKSPKRPGEVKFAGHGRKSNGVITANFVLWTPKHEQRKQDEPALTYIDLLRKDTYIPADDPGNCLSDRTMWWSIIV